MIATLAPLLAQRGVGDRPAPECQAVSAHVERRGAGLALTMQTEAGRVSKLVDDVETAATIIESWARTDLSAPLYAASDPQSTSSTLPAGAPPVTATVAVSAPSQPGRFVVGAAAEGSLGFDGSAWAGALVDGWTRVGGVGLGLAARVAGSPTTTLPGGLAYDRLGVDLLVRLGVPIAVGRVRLVPSLGLGMGWMHTSYQDGNLYHGTRSSAGLRGELSITAGVMVSRHLELDASLVVTGNFLNGDSDDAALQVGGDPDDRLPQLTSGVARLGLGLRWSTP